MKRTATLLALGAAATLSWAACGDDVTAPGRAIDNNDPGTGTSTMMVTADIEGEEVSGGFLTELEVELRDEQDEPISGATVTVSNDELGTVTLLEEHAGSGRYEATRNQFAGGDYQLEVVKGEDNVTGVVVGGIAVHEIQAPAPDTTVSSDEPLEVVWSRVAEAAGVDIETRDFEAEGVRDSGSYTIPAENNPEEDDQRVRVRRFNEVDISGGLFGSRLRLSIRNSVEPIVVQ